MATVKFENVSLFIRDNGLKTFRVLSGKDTNNKVFESDPEKDIEKNIQEFESRMQIVHGGYFLLQGSKTDKIANGYFTIEFSNIGTPPAAAQNQQMQVQMTGLNGYVSREELEKQLEFRDKQAENKFLEHELKRREEELKEAERNFNSRQNSGLELILNRIGMIMEKHPPLKRVAGFNGEKSNTNVQILDVETIEGDELEEKVSDLLARWQKVDPDWLAALEGLVKIAETDNATYSMAKKFL